MAVEEERFVTAAVCKAQHRFNDLRVLGFASAVGLAISMATYASTVAWQASAGVEKIEAILTERSKAVDIQAETVKAQLELLNTKLDMLSQEVRKVIKPAP